MGKGSKIGWTDHTFNPWWGCTRVSPGCGQGEAACYAETFDRRIHGKGNEHWGVKAPRRFFGDKHWNEPLKWNAEAARAGARARVFSGSMCDVCEDRPDLVEHRARLALLILNTPWLDWLLLTKRPENFVRLFGEYFGPVWPANVWAGATMENQEWAERRWPHLARVPAAVLFASCEPLLGAVDLRHLRVNASPLAGLRAVGGGSTYDALAGEVVNDLGVEYATRRLGWVITGGQSGRGANPMHPEWARGLRGQCSVTGTPFFFKQWGEWRPVCQDAGPDNWSDALYVSSRIAKPHEDQAHLDDVYGRRCTVPELVLRTDGNHRNDVEAYRSDRPGWPAVLAFRVGTAAAGHVLDGVEHLAVPASPAATEAPPLGGPPRHACPN